MRTAQAQLDAGSWAAASGAERGSSAAGRAIAADRRFEAYYAANYRSRIEDIAYYVDRARALGGPVLEYGVGNGRIALPLARHGLEVVGVDRSRSMLADFRWRLRTSARMFARG